MESPPICCVNCGEAVELGEYTRLAAATAQKRISELEAQVKILSDKATAAGKLSMLLDFFFFFPLR